MSAAITRRERFSARSAIWLGVAALIAVVLGANAHLLYVAITSQPDCVQHQKPGAAGEPGSFSAAKSACSPAPEVQP